MKAVDSAVPIQYVTNPIALWEANHVTIFLNQLKFRYYEAAGSKIVACFARTQNVRVLFRFVKRSIVCQLFV